MRGVEAFATAKDAKELTPVNKIQTIGAFHDFSHAFLPQKIFSYQSDVLIGAEKLDAGLRTQVEQIFETEKSMFTLATH